MELAIILVIIAIIIVSRGVKVVPQQHAWVVERLGKYDRTLAPGLSFIVPFIDRVAYKHMQKEVPLDIASQICITRDNTQLTVDGILYFQVMDSLQRRGPQKALHVRPKYLVFGTVSSCR